MIPTWHLMLKECESLQLMPHYKYRSALYITFYLSTLALALPRFVPLYGCHSHVYDLPIHPGFYNKLYLKLVWYTTTLVRTQSLQMTHLIKRTYF